MKIEVIDFGAHVQIVIAPEGVEVVTPKCSVLLSNEHFNHVVESYQKFHSEDSHEVTEEPAEHEAPSSVPAALIPGMVAPSEKSVGKMVNGIEKMFEGVKGNMSDSEKELAMEGMAFLNKLLGRGKPKKNDKRFRQ